MREQMLASFCDELRKIAVNSMSTETSSNIEVKPASTSNGPRVATNMKAMTKPTNYSMVHNSQPEAAQGTADESKSVPPPPVRT